MILANLTSSCRGHVLYTQLQPVQLNRHTKQPGEEFDARNAVPNFHGKGTAQRIYSSGVCGFRSVSYTHLDVYKRQLQELVKLARITAVKSLPLSQGFRAFVPAIGAFA